MKEITVSYVKHVLGHKKEMISDGRKRMKELYEEINSTDFSIREAAYTKVLNDIPQTSSHSKDLSDILLKQKKIYQEQAQDLQSEIISILEERKVYIGSGFVFVHWKIRKEISGRNLCI